MSVRFGCGLMGVWAVVFGLGSPVLAAVQLQTQFTGETLNLQFSGLASWQYNLERKVEGNRSIVEMTLPTLAPQALKDLRSALEKMGAKVEVPAPQSQPVGSSYLRAVFPRPDTEVFDYLTDQPSRLIVDFFPDPKQSKKSSSASIDEKTPPSKGKSKAVSRKPEVREPARVPASDAVQMGEQALGSLTPDQGLSSGRPGSTRDSNDPNFDRFSIPPHRERTNAISEIRENVYIPLPMLRPDLFPESELEATQPIYRVIPKDSDENRQARLLQVLWERKRIQVFLKTAKWFQEKYPKSEYMELVDFMRADALFELWMESGETSRLEQALQAYEEALSKYPESPAAERTWMLLGRTRMENRDYLGVLRLAQRYLRTKPKGPNRDLMGLAQAEAYLRLRQWPEAEASLREVQKTGSSERARQAMMLVGNIPFTQANYPQAVLQYTRALEAHPQNPDPGTVFNRAVAYFETGELRQSLNSFVDFIRIFPDHSYAGFAMTRAGELLSAMGAPTEQVVAAYLETYFRYGAQPSSAIARIRLLAERMPQMKAKELKASLEEITTLAKESKLEGMERFSKVVVADGFGRRKEYAKAIDILVKYFQDNPTSIHQQVVRSRIVGNINGQIRDALDRGDFLDALATHSKYQDTWLQGLDRLDTPFLVAKALELAGLSDQAEKIYRSTANRLMNFRAGAGASKLSGSDQVPSLESVQLRLASVTLEQKKLKEADQALQAIRNPASLSSQEQLERVQLLADITNQKGDPAHAVRYIIDLIHEWKAKPSQVAPLYLQLGDLELRQNKVQEALRSWRNVDRLQAESKDVPAVVHRQALERIGNTQFDRSEYSEAMSAYQQLLEAYETATPMPLVRYRVGLMQFQKGELQAAADTWRALDTPRARFWFQLGQEKLASADFQDRYRNYVDRIPAMASPRMPSSETNQ